MEDSERRRERLRAMRAEAVQASGPVEASSPSPGLLANPLIETTVVQTPQPMQRQEGSSRFGFYTDPMAAFSSNRKRGPTPPPPPPPPLSSYDGRGYATPPFSGSSPVPRFSSPRPGSMNDQRTPPPARMMQSNYSPNQRMYQPQGPYQSYAPYGSPRGMAGAFPMHQGTPEAWNVYASHGGMNSSYPMHPGSPGFGRSPSSDYEQGRTHWRSRGSPNPNSQRGQQWQQGRNMSPQFRQSGGRGGGRGSRPPNLVPNESLGPESFYSESMLKDPWEHLEPVLWKGLPVSSNWLPRSIKAKKQRFSESAGQSNTSQSLAEYLAASFNEAIDEAPSV